MKGDMDNLVALVDFLNFTLMFVYIYVTFLCMRSIISSARTVKIHFCVCNFTCMI